MNILRPLLELQKAELQEVCRSEGVEWVEDPSNQSSDYLRNNVRKILHGDSDLVHGVTQLVHTCQNAREVLKHQGMMECGMIEMLMTLVSGLKPFDQCCRLITACSGYSFDKGRLEVDLPSLNKQ